jgi:hypothetical protein
MEMWIKRLKRLMVWMLHAFYTGCGGASVALNHAGYVERDRPMAKQGQHKRDGNDPRVSRGHNNPSKSTPITTGTYKKPETYRKQAAEHEDTSALPQYAKNEWHESTPKDVTKKDIVGDSSRSGSDSNANSETRGH